MKAKCYFLKIIRVHPIRVGNTKDGHSGGCYSDQKEITWDEIGVEPETTTVTGRQRRIFTPSPQQFMEALIACQPTDVFLNFINYDPALGYCLVENLNKMMAKHCSKGSRVRWLGWGPTESNIKDQIGVH